MVVATRFERISFAGQHRAINILLNNRDARIHLAEASRSTVSSTSKQVRPCLSVNLFTDGGRVWLTVPAGTSAGEFEPLSLTQDKDGFQVAEKAMFDGHIKARLEGAFPDPLEIDTMLEEVNDSLPVPEGRDNALSRIGGPTATATSLATVLAFARAAGVSDEVAMNILFNMVAEKNNLPRVHGMSLPIYQSKIVDGGLHGPIDKNNLPLTPVQEFLFMPMYGKYTDALDALFDVNARFWDLLRKRNYQISVGAEAGIVSPQLTSTFQVLQLMSLAIRGEGKEKPLPGIVIAMDVAAASLYELQGNKDKYYLGADGEKMFGTPFVNHVQLTEYYNKLVDLFPIFSIEDPYSDNPTALSHWREGFPRLSDRVLVITDDLSVTQPERVRMATEWGVGGLLTKVNQGGTFSRSALAMAIAKSKSWVTSCSHRSSEASDFYFEAALAVAAMSEFIKVTVGSMHGGGGGREARVNFLSNANVVWNNAWKEMGPSHPDWEIFNASWDNIPPELRMNGLPYQGSLLLAKENPQPWLKRMQEFISLRKAEALDSERAGKPISSYPSYRFGSLDFAL